MGMLNYEVKVSHRDEPCSVCGDIATLTYEIEPKFMKAKKVTLTLCGHCLSALVEATRKFDKRLFGLDRLPRNPLPKVKVKLL